MRDRLDSIVFFVTLAAVVLALGLMGERDYADAITAERDALRRQLRVCETGGQLPPAPARHLTRLEH
jgi:hypothetical protein